MKPSRARGTRTSCTPATCAERGERVRAAVTDARITRPSRGRAPSKRWLRAPWALLALLVLGACRGKSSGQAQPPVPSAPPLGGAGPSTSTTPSEGTAGLLPAPLPDAASVGLDEATLERRTFRQIVVGGLVHPPKRLTWVLFRSAARVRLHLFCQNGAPPAGHFGISLDGKESEEAMWGVPTRMDYVGKRVNESPLSYRIAAASGPVGDTACEKAPSILLLSCRPEQVSVLHAGAALVVGRKGPDDAVPWHWQPPASERVAATRCDLAERG
jgi:hypothetical protein